MRNRMKRVIELMRLLDSKASRKEKLAELKRCRLDGTLDSDDVAELIDLYRLEG